MVSAVLLGAISCLLAAQCRAFIPQFIASPTCHQSQDAGLSLKLDASTQKSVSSASPASDPLTGIIGWFERLFNPSSKTEMPTPKQAPKAPRRSGGPVALVFGGTGRAGREIVVALRAEGYDVVAAVRNESKASAIFGAVIDADEPGQGLLDVVGGVDVTKMETLTGASEALFDNVSHVVLALGPVSGPLPGGGFGFYPGSSSQDIDYQGVANVVDALKARDINCGADATVKSLFSFKADEDLSRWQRLDDVIMGGQSSSALSLGPNHAKWEGDLVVAGGGFCGTRASGTNVELTGYDGLRLRIKGNGQRFKLNLKAADEDMPSESVYQVAFDTVQDAWITVDLPFDRFVPVVRNRVNYKGSPLKEKAKKGLVASLFGLVYSRFEFNRQPNPKYTPGPFTLEISDISAYKATRPAVVLISSAGVERNAKITTDDERRAEIPIVQLNPGGILNWKYKGEAHLRASGLPYTIIRACGLVPERILNKTARLQAGQGDEIVGTLTRTDLASAVVGALQSPYAAYKSLEIRRDEAADAVGRSTDFDRLYGGLVLDTDRALSGITPFPDTVEPPPDVSAERRQEILQDPRVQATVARDSQVPKDEQERKEGSRQPAVAGTSA